MQQINFVAADKLRNHVSWFIQNKIAVMHFFEKNKNNILGGVKTDCSILINQ